MHYSTAGGGPEAFVRRHLSMLTALLIMSSWPTLSVAQDPAEALGVDSNGNSLLTLDFQAGLAEIVNSDGGDYQSLHRC